MCEDTWASALPWQRSGFGGLGDGHFIFPLILQVEAQCRVEWERPSLEMLNFRALREYPGKIIWWNWDKTLPRTQNQRVQNWVLQILRPSRLFHPHLQSVTHMCSKAWEAPNCGSGSRQEWMFHRTWEALLLYLHGLVGFMLLFQITSLWENRCCLQVLWLLCLDQHPVGWFLEPCWSEQALFLVHAYVICYKGLSGCYLP